MSVFFPGSRENCLNVKSLTYTKTGEGSNTVIEETYEQTALRDRQVTYWSEKEILVSKFEFASKCIALYSSLFLPYAIKNRGKSLSGLASMIGVLSYVVKLLAARVEAKAREQREAWSIPMEHRAWAAEFTKMIDGVDRKGMSTEQYIWHLFQYQRQTPPSPLEEKVGRLVYLFNFLKASVRKKLV